MPRRHPDWIKVKAPGNPNYLRLKRLMREKNLHTVAKKRAARTSVSAGATRQRRF
jgi:lipoate synthase